MAPPPQRLRYAAGSTVVRSFHLALHGWSRLELADALADLGRRQRISRTGRGQAVALRLVRRALPRRGSQSYRLRVDAAGVTIEAASPPGVWNAVQTLGQIVSHGPRVPHVVIDDWPDFPVRGVMLDISRDKVPTMAALRATVAWLASLKVNQLQLYMEHTFAYRRHRAVWHGSSPMTGAEVRELDAYCRARGIELVPNQNTLGHMERWLRHPRYAPLAEAIGPWKSPWGDIRHTRTTLNPTDPRSLTLAASLLGELVPHFASRCVNVGCDEPFELGQGRSREACEKRGLGRVYLDYVGRLHRVVRRLGREMMMWGDVVARHPALVRRLPRGVVLLEWGYEADHPFARRGAAYRAAGLRFYVCPGTSSWCSMAGRTSNAIENLTRAARAGRRFGAEGYLVTDWGDFGHRQPWSVSVGPLVVGAAAGWNSTTRGRLDAAASRFGFGDRSGRTGRAWFDLGRVHELSGVRLSNKSVLFQCLQSPFGDAAGTSGLTPGAIRRMRTELRRLRRTTRDGRSMQVAGDAVVREWRLAWRVLDHACRRAEAMLAYRRGRRIDDALLRLAADLREIVRMHRQVWRARNRPGGLADSVRHYQRNLDEYLSLRTAARRPPPKRQVRQ